MYLLHFTLSVRLPMSSTHFSYLLHFTLSVRLLRLSEHIYLLHFTLSVCLDHQNTSVICYILHCLSVCLCHQNTTSTCYFLHCQSACVIRTPQLFVIFCTVRLPVMKTHQLFVFNKVSASISSSWQQRKKLIIVRGQ